jgi:ribosome-associated translation inhibitor RaiA/cold shock CspA family protein
MQIPLQITFRHMPPSPALENRIRHEAAKLEQFHEHILSCRVVLEAPHKHHHKGRLFHLHIDLKAPGKEMVANRIQHDRHAHEDAYTAIRDAFHAMRRQVEDYAKRQHRDVKQHEIPDHGRICQLVPMQDYGKIETLDGREIYFHRNSVLENAYNRLTEGDEVRFVEELGAEGPQASTVILSGKHHIVG